MFSLRSQALYNHFDSHLNMQWSMHWEVLAEGYVSNPCCEPRDVRSIGSFDGTGLI